MNLFLLPGPVCAGFCGARTNREIPGFFANRPWIAGFPRGSFEWPRRACEFFKARCLSVFRRSLEKPLSPRLLSNLFLGVGMIAALAGRNFEAYQSAGTDPGKVIGKAVALSFSEICPMKEAS